MSLDLETLSVVAIAAAAVAVVALGVALRATSRLRRMRRTLRTIQSSPGESFEDASDVLRALTDVVKRVDDLEVVAGLAIQHVGLVRFDAFEDMGGHLSFAVAMLDAIGDGFVLSSINGRQETRIYAKPIEDGVSRYHLSDEEQEAIRRALAPRFRSQ